ncbi:MAG: hypothetical protein AAGI70_14835 [Pseudomonadota bacterium]
MTNKSKTPATLADAELDATSGGFGLARKVEGLADARAQDRLGNFEIQDLMSRFNQAETLASSVQKKTDDAKSAVIGKI